jgi:hypothetical protein
MSVERVSVKFATAVGTLKAVVKCTFVILVFPFANEHLGGDARYLTYFASIPQYAGVFPPVGLLLVQHTVVVVFSVYILVVNLRQLHLIAPPTDR